jgi:predicted ATP-dependent Lon-type protease
VDLVDAINILIQKNQEDTQLTIQFQTLEQMKISTPQKKVLILPKKCTITSGLWELITLNYNGTIGPQIPSMTLTLNLMMILR